MLELNFTEKIRPFFFVEWENSYSVCLHVGDYKRELFASRADDGFMGNGYDWTALAEVFLAEKASALAGRLLFDSEAVMFCVYSYDVAAVQEFTLAFRAALDDDALILDLLARALPD